MSATPEIARAHATRRRATVSIALFLIVGGIAVVGPDAWYWISTERDHRWTKREIARGYIPDSARNLPGTTRMLRWGKDAGDRHGPYWFEDESGTISGRFHRGSAVGRWEGCAPDGTLLRVGLPMSRADHRIPRRIGPVTVVILGYRSWMVEGCTIGPFNSDRGALVATLRRDGSVEIRTGSLVELFVDPIHRYGTSVTFDATGGLRSIRHFHRGDPDGLWTEFAPGGVIVEQSIHLLGMEQDRRTAPPWYDVVLGLDPTRPIFHPITGERIE